MDLKHVIKCIICLFNEGKVGDGVYRTARCLAKFSDVKGILQAKILIVSVFTHPGNQMVPIIVWTQYQCNSMRINGFMLPTFF